MDINIIKFKRDYAEKLYTIEQSREESILTQSGRMITVQGLSLTVITFLSSIYKDNNQSPVVNLELALLFILFSLLFSILVQFRFPKLSFTRIKTFENTISRYSDVTKLKEEDIDFYFYNSMKKIEAHLRMLNNLRSCFIILSLLSFFVGIALLIANVFTLI